MRKNKLVIVMIIICCMLVPTCSSQAKKAGKETKCIVIDAGHQSKGNSSKEPIGPGSSKMKAKVAGGATGVATGQREYQLNLSVSKLLKNELTKRGYKVIMVRETNNVDISNSKRAAIANNAKADAFIRIHANGSTNRSVNGALTMCQTSRNPYNAKYYSKSYALSKAVLNGVVKGTGAKNQGISRTDSMSGINWCKVPVTIVEMGFLSNPKEDRLLASVTYQKKMAKAIANGVDQYFK